jgi:hypothetical protein
MQPDWTPTNLIEMKATFGLLYLITIRGNKGMPVDYSWATNPAYGISSN